jgi:hypothetical protein
VYLDLWARSAAEIQTLQNAVHFLDDYNLASFGNAIRIQYKFQSDSKLTEAQNRQHLTALYAVRYGDKRKMVSG